jgi:ubiquinone/menaquinone biosynthesis C-methylase UbiE
MADRRYLPALRFRALTRFYDPAIRLTTREETFKRRLVEQASLGDRDRVLDLGCGTGTLAMIAKRDRPTAEVWGLDADPEMLDRALRKAGEAGLEIHFDEGLSSALPYPDGCFDGVLSTLFFHHLQPAEKRLTIAEVARVLRPGGELHVADWGRPSDPLMRLLSLQIRFGDGAGPTGENLSGALPDVFRRGGLAEVAQTDRLRTPFGTLALYRARRPAA